MYVSPLSPYRVKQTNTNTTSSISLMATKSPTIHRLLLPKNPPLAGCSISSMSRILLAAPQHRLSVSAPPQPINQSRFPKVVHCHPQRSRIQSPASRTLPGLSARQTTATRQAWMILLASLSKHLFTVIATSRHLRLWAAACPAAAQIGVHHLHCRH